MKSSLPIQYIRSQEMDTEKWDRCITHSPNGLIYGYTYYLDHMAKEWDALVLGDYEAVMPLTWNRKYGIFYLYQPFLTAQLGVFGKNITGELLSAFLENIPRRFKYWDIYLNHQNVFPLKPFELYQRVNYVLNLQQPYDDLYNHYRENIQRNIRRAMQSGCVITRNFDVEKVIGLAIEQMKGYTKESAENVGRFRKLYAFLQPRKQATTYGILSSTGQLIASCIFLFSHQRAYYILVGNHPDGRTIGASHALIDAFIKDHAGTNMILDFEGSDIPNLAFFYSSFGAKEENYAAIRMNRLPFYLKWVKR